MCLRNPKIQLKSDQLSDKYREEGNKAYRSSLKGNMMSALWLYNQALCYAQSNDRLALAYANRSAVFLNFKRYDLCLKNIKLAREHGYPASKMTKLDERETECKKKKKNTTQDLYRRFLKLSHPPNPKIPFIADCLEYRPSNGGGIYTTCDLKAGDFIAIEPVAYGFLDETAQYTRCAYCFKTNMCNLIPCLKCASVMFCSEECRDKTYEKFKDMHEMIQFHPDECYLLNYERALAFGDEAFGTRTKLKVFIKENNFTAMKKTVFDFDFSGSPDDPEYKKNILKCILSLKSTAIKHRVERMDHEPTHIAEDPETLKYLRHFVKVYHRNYSCNYTPSPIHPMLEGFFIYPFMRLFKHSCYNNVGFIQMDTQMLFYVAVPVKAGQELFINYCGVESGPFVHNTINRKLRLSQHEIDDCNCYFCANNIDQSKLKDHDTEEFWKEFADYFNTRNPNRKMRHDLEKIWGLISEASDDPLSLRVEKMRILVDRFLIWVSHFISYPGDPW